MRGGPPDLSPDFLQFLLDLPSFLSHDLYPVLVRLVQPMLPVQLVLQLPLFYLVAQARLFRSLERLLLKLYVRHLSVETSFRFGVR